LLLNLLGFLLWVFPKERKKGTRGLFCGQPLVASLLTKELLHGYNIPERQSMYNYFEFKKFKNKKCKSIIYINNNSR